MKDNIFDYIVYPANYQGIVFARYAAKAGKNVLLLNRYGFPGGDITFALNCLQRTTRGINGLVNEIETSLIKSKNSLLFADEFYNIYNPEVIKSVLLDIIDVPNISRLFHILPIKLDFSNDYSDITVLLKEGQKEFKAKYIVDASETGDLLDLMNKKNDKDSQFHLNFFIKDSFIDLNIANVQLLHKIKLTDSRAWVSLRLEETNNFNIEIRTHEILTKLEELAYNQGSRIQILPVQHLEYKDLNNTEKVDRIIFLRNDFNLTGKITNRVFDCISLEKQLVDYEF
jgi:hypothetical protein